MEKIVEIGKWILENGPALLMAISAVLSALIAVCMIIPGEQPEKALQGIVEFLAKFSRKPISKE
jgi:hypothetical protein